MALTTFRHRTRSPALGGILLVAGLLLGSSAAWAAESAGAEASAAESTDTTRTFESGVHYEELLLPSTPADSSTVEVVEMFSYLCIHCFNFDSHVQAWEKRKGDGVTFMRIPAIFNKTWGLYAQAFYTAEALGVSDRVHDALFEAVHTYRRDLRTPEAIAGLFKEVAGVERADFNKAFNSFSVRSKVQQADTRARQFRLQSVPTMIVNGKYKTDSTMAGSNLGMLQVVDFLVKKEQASKQAAAR